MAEPTITHERRLTGRLSGARRGNERRKDQPWAWFEGSQAVQTDADQGDQRASKTEQGENPSDRRLKSISPEETQELPTIWTPNHFCKERNRATSPGLTLN